MARDILDAVYGCLIGGAIGDALGAPVEGLYYTEIRERYGKITELMPSTIGNTGTTYGGSAEDSFREAYDGPVGKPGATTDDTAYRHYLCYAIVRKGGRITPDDWAQVWLEKLNPRRFWVNEKAILWKLKAGMNPWDAGRGSIPAGCATMGIAPIGIINAANPAQAFQDAFNIAFLNQEDYNRDAAATMAAGVAAALTPGATVESVLGAMASHSTYIVSRAIEMAMDLACASGSVEEFTEKYYARLLDWTWPCPPQEKWNKDHNFSGSSAEVVSVSAALLHLCQGDVNRCLVEGASFGRDCDTIAGLVGSLAGALQGASAIRSDWIETCERANEDLFVELEGDGRANFHSMARRLVEALRAEQRAAQERAELLQRMLA